MTTPRMRTGAVALAVIGAAGLVLAGCKDDSKPAASTSSMSSSSTASASAPSSAAPAPAPPVSSSSVDSSTAPAGPTGDTCRSSALDPAVAQNQGAAGSTIITVSLTNTGSAECTMTGFPGVSLVAPGSGQQLGAAADRNGDAGAPVHLQPGQKATFDVKITRAGAQAPENCASTPAEGLRIYPPGETAALFLKVPNLTGCTSDSSHLLAVKAVQQG